MAIWHGTKKELCKVCIETIGVDATYTEVRKWCKQHGSDISESQFYTVRHEVRRSIQDAAILDEADAVPKPSIASAVLQRAEQLSPSAVATLENDSIVDLVRATKKLVDKLGKEEAKNLIDAL